MERVAPIAAMSDGIGERAQHFDELDDRTGPAVRHHERQRVVLRRTHVQEVQRGSVDARAELRELVQRSLVLPPVVVVGPIATEVAQEGDVDSVSPFRVGPRFGPTRGA